MIDELIKKYPVNINMITDDQVRTILTNLQKVISKKVKGDVVELGCNIGTTSIYIQSMVLETNKAFHVYDSFQGLPEPNEHDYSEDEKKFGKGDAATPIESFIETFNKYSVPAPRIHVGWFSDIKEEDIPEKISFAFFDGDFYSSIMDSWNKIYPRLSKGAIVCIHDYMWAPLPGVLKACNDFLQDKPEYGTIVSHNHMGVMMKL
jgi:O-methyltransferase